MSLHLRKSEPVNRKAGFSLLSAGRLAAAFFCAGITCPAAQPATSETGVSEFSFRAWTQQNGLPTNEVTGLSRSRSGYLIVGTPNGVVRFDGRQFSAMTHTAETAIHDRGISAFASIPGSDEILAAPRLGGLLRLSGDDFSPYALPERFAQTPIEALFFENDITLWIGFRGGFALRKQAGRLEVFDASAGLNEHEPIQFARDSRGGVWLASGSFLARYENGHLVPAGVLGGGKKEHVRIASSRTDGPWVIVGEEVSKVSGGRLKPIARLSQTTGAYYIQALLEDASGELWIGTRSAGLHRLAADNKLRHVAEAPEDISALLEDVAGNLWVGTANSGILRIKAAVLDVFDRSAGLLERRSLSLCRDNDGVLWFANRDGGIVFRDARSRFSVFEPTRAWEDFSAYSVSPAKGGGIWAATTHGLLRINDGKIQAQFTQDFLTGRATPRVTLTAKNGDLWLALDAGGVCRFRDGEFVRFDLKRVANALAVCALSEAPDGSIWAGCDDGSLHRLENGETFFPVELGVFAGKVGAIQAICFDEAGTAWIGTQKGGLLRLNTRGLAGVSRQQGLVSENVTQIMADDRGALWLGSTGAIFHVGIDELEKFFRGETRRIYPVTVGPDEGLNEATCSADYQPAVTKTEDGRLWFATRQGVVAIDPEKETAAPERPRVKITGVSIDDRLQTASPVTRLAPNPRAVELRYSAPNLSVPERVRMRHRLTGYDDDWQENEREGVAKYARLPLGKYRFEVAALLAGVPGAESADSITVEVPAAWWQTFWFRLFSAALAVGVVVIVVRHVSHRRLIEKLARLERERALERERTRIAENIHDDLGAGLTRISLLTQSGHDKAKSQLDRIYDIVGDLIQSMDEIVWAVNPSNDDLESVANYLAEYAQSYCADAGLRCRVKIPKSLPYHALTTQFRHHLFLSCKEALNNVVKHAQAADVSVEVFTDDNTLTITLSDNGTGLPDGIEAMSRRNGLKNMRSRMRMLGGDATFARATPQGTVVTLTARLSQSASTP
jgi:signal transduction histidine kinase/ligand-binding sensor domain-containing protein